MCVCMYIYVGHTIHAIDSRYATITVQPPYNRLNMGYSYYDWATIAICMALSKDTGYMCMCGHTIRGMATKVVLAFTTWLSACRPTWCYA